jgi:hypothetical protein
MKKLFTTCTKHKQLFPIFILTFFVITTIISTLKGTIELNGEVYDFGLTTKHYLGFAILIILYLMYFFKRPYFKYFLGITIILGLFNFINFTPTLQTSSFKIGNLKISFQPYILIIGVFSYILNYKKINGFIFLYIRPFLEQNKQEGINKFIDKFKSYSNEQLENILNDNRYNNESKDASKLILLQRK